MPYAFICDAVRTPIGRYGGRLATIRADDLGAIPLRALLERNRNLEPSAIEEVFYGCANQSGEDNRNVARMSALLAGLPVTVPGVTLNRLCASGLEAVGYAARAIACGDMELAIAGGVESMSRAPFVIGKADSAFARNQVIEGAAARFGLTSRARIIGMASSGVAPRVMGIGPVPATNRLLARHQLKIGQFDVIELNEAFASQSLASLRAFGLPDDAQHVNANGGAIALGHPLGMTGARLAMTLVHQLMITKGRLGLATLCVGVGQGLALAVEAV